MAATPHTQIRKGTVVELSTKLGFVYGHYVCEHTKQPGRYGTLVRILPGTYQRRVEDLVSLVEKEGGWFCFWPVKDAIRKGEAERAGFVPVPKEYQRIPLMKLATRDIRTKRVKSWAIWNGNTRHGRTVSNLTPQEKKYSLVEIVFTPDVIKRIESGWTPEEECKPGATSVKIPIRYLPGENTKNF